MHEGCVWVRIPHLHEETTRPAPAFSPRANSVLAVADGGARMGETRREPTVGQKRRRCLRQPSTHAGSSRPEGTTDKALGASASLPRACVRVLRVRPGRTVGRKAPWLQDITVQRNGGVSGRREPPPLRRGLGAGRFLLPRLGRRQAPAREQIPTSDPDALTSARAALRPSKCISSLVSPSGSVTVLTCQKAPVRKPLRMERARRFPAGGGRGGRAGPQTTARGL